MYVTPSIIRVVGGTYVLYCTTFGQVSFGYVAATATGEPWYTHRAFHPHHASGVYVQMRLQFFLRGLGPLVVMLLAALACNAPGGQAELIEQTNPTVFIAPSFTPDPVIDTGDDAAQAEVPAAEPVQDGSAAEAPVENPTDPPAPTPTVSPAGGFVGLNTFAISELPMLTGLGGGAGGGGSNCALGAPIEGSPPDITYTWLDTNRMSVCIYGLPAQVGAPEFAVRLTAPDGTEYSETYNIVEELEIRGSRTPEDLFIGRGIVGEEGRMDSLSVALKFEADVFQKGNWTIRVERTDGQLWFEVIEFIELPNAWNTVLPPGEVSDPLVPEFGSGGYVYSTFSIASVYGDGYPENSDLVIALYGGEPVPVPDTPWEALSPQYAAVVRTDETGAFRADFQVGLETPPDRYAVIINPQAREDFSFAITKSIVVE